VVGASQAASMTSAQSPAAAGASAQDRVPPGRWHCGYCRRAAMCTVV